MKLNDKFTKKYVAIAGASIIAVGGAFGIILNIPQVEAIDIPESEPVVQHLDVDSDLAQMAADVEPTPFIVEKEQAPVVEETNHYVPEQTYTYNYTPEPTYTYTAAPDPTPTYTAPSSGTGNFQSDGVWYDDNYRYTWYSSNAAYHYRTPEWSAGSDGIYRDSEGYVVVASSDYAQGTVIEDTPFGAAKVYDTGCASGTLDVYTNY